MDTTLARPREGLRPRGRRYLENLLSGAGIEINGGRPYDMRVLDNRIFNCALTAGVEGVLDAYVEGWWETDRLDELTARVLSNGISLPESRRVSVLLASLSGKLFNGHTRRRTLKLRRHYDLGNELFEAMLDPRLTYSCAYWENASTLDHAQEAKLDLIARKAGLRPGMCVLEIGCGWGGFARFVAEKYGVSVVAITIAKEQYKLAKSRCKGLPVEIRLQDYRDLKEQPFDAVVSIAMFEAVGYKNYRNFMKIVRRHMEPEALFLLHTIGGNSTKTYVAPWIQRNIFQTGMLPSAGRLAAAAEAALVIEDWHGFGADYDKTLTAWSENFDAAWPRLRETNTASASTVCGSATCLLAPAPSERGTCSFGRSSSRRRASAADTRACAERRATGDGALDPPGSAGLARCSGVGVNPLFSPADGRSTR